MRQGVTVVIRKGERMRSLLIAFAVCSVAFAQSNLGIKANVTKDSPKETEVKLSLPGWEVGVIEEYKLSDDLIAYKGSVLSAINPTEFRKLTIEGNFGTGSNKSVDLTWTFEVFACESTINIKEDPNPKPESGQKKVYAVRIWNTDSDGAFRVKIENKTSIFNKEQTFEMGDALELEGRKTDKGYILLPCRQSICSGDVGEYLPPAFSDTAKKVKFDLPKFGAVNFVDLAKFGISGETVSLTSKRANFEAKGPKLDATDVKTYGGILTGK